jgi:two-component system cell cycle sensor histidine kinase/response regulator CckA
MTMSSLTQAKRAGRTILVVDDERGILDLIQRVLEHANYHVITSRSGDHAWDVIERGQPKVDLVFTDIVMPGSMDGFTLAEMTRERRLLRKPFSPKELLEFVDSHLGESGAQSR